MLLILSPIVRNIEFQEFWIIRMLCWVISMLCNVQLCMFLADRETLSVLVSRLRLRGEGQLQYSAAAPTPLTWHGSLGEGTLIS